MKIHHQGWNETVGAFNCDVTIDEERSDHEIHCSDGTVFHQLTPFEFLITNHRDTQDSHSTFGAFFIQNGAKEFFTPQELASLVLNGYAVIPGLQIEEHQENLSDRIQAATDKARRMTELQNNVPAQTVSAQTR